MLYEVITGLMEGVLMVVRHGATDRKVAIKTAEQIRQGYGQGIDTIAVPHEQAAVAVAESQEGDRVAGVEQGRQLDSGGEVPELVV